MEITPDQIENAFDKIPQTLSKAIREINISQIIHEICTSHNIHIDKEGILSSEVWYVLLGLSDAESLPRKIGSQIIVPGLDPNALITEINEKIFLPVKHRMMENEENLADELDEEEVEAEELVMERAGVHIETTTPAPQVSDSLTLSRELTLEGIENPTPTPDIPLSQTKLETPHSIPPETTDHSINGLSSLSPSIPPASPQRTIDPYREIPS